MSEDHVKVSEDITREPILLNHNTIALLQIFHKTDDIEDMWAWWMEKLQIEHYEVHEKAAKQFVSQLKEHWCIAFMESLKKEIDIILDEHEKMIKESRA